MQGKISASSSNYNNVLITGGAGFIGSHLSEIILKAGKTVICVDDLNNYYDPQLKRANLARLFRDPQFVYEYGDIRDLKLLEDVFNKYNIDAVVHLAARAGVRPSVESPFLYSDVNVRGTLNILECCKSFRVPKLVFISSSSVYGNNRKVPFHEDDLLVSLASPYASTKMAGEALCQSYHHLYGISIGCLRLFTVYGPRQRPDMAINKFASSMLRGEPIIVYGDGSSRRDYTYVKDIVDGIIRTLEARLGFEIFNIGNSQTVELSRLISLLEKEINTKAKIVREPAHPGDVPVTYADISKASELLGYKPEVSIEEGISRYIDWFKSQSKARTPDTGSVAESA